MTDSVGASSSSSAGASQNSASDSASDSSNESSTTAESIANSPTTADNLAGGSAANDSSNPSSDNSGAGNNSGVGSLDAAASSASKDSSSDSKTNANSDSSSADSGNSSTDDGASNTSRGIGSMDAAAAAATNANATTQNDSSDDDTATQSSVVGISAAVGREQVVQGVLDRSYQAGLTAPQESYNGQLHRGVPSLHENNALGYAHSNEGLRYNAPGQHTVYGAPTQSGAIAELSIYPTTENRTFTQFDTNITPNPRTGAGGVANLHSGLQQQNLPESVFTQPSHSRTNAALHAVTGEHRYSAPQQAAKGAVDAGAAGIRAPSAVGGSQIDILPANADPSQITPVSRQTRTPAGDMGPVRSAATVTPLADYHTTVTPGQVDMPAGSASRASSMRYGALGGAADSLVQSGISALNGQEVNGQQVARDVAINTTVGGVAARATDALAPRMGMARAGGAVGGAIQATVSGISNYQQYSAGEISGERAIANTVVDTGTAIAAGATGAAVGAAVGSVVPVAGTAVGAAAGFAVGVGAHYAIQAIDSVTGITQSAKDGLTNALESASSWVSSWWN